RSDRTMSRLSELQSPFSTVLRDGHQQDVPIGEICVGDVLILQTGTKIPADTRLISSIGLLVNEGPLTGESAPQAKDATTNIPVDAPLAERTTAIFSGTTVLDGQGVGIVLAVGIKSELGRIAGLTAGVVSTPTPLQKEMGDLARTLAFAALGISALIPLIGWFRGYDLNQMLLTWLSLTFLMVPGQPPIIITMALALASFELARKKVVVRRLQGAETLGSANAIVSDKTGTMTENIMAFDRLIIGNGTILAKNQMIASQMPLWTGFFAKSLQAIPEITINPTDLGIINAAREMQISNNANTNRLVHQVGFETGKFYRSLEYENQTGRQLIYLAGSPEFIIANSTQQESGGQINYWGEEERNRILELVHQFASEGKRITAYAYRTLTVTRGLPKELIFVGCAVFEDPIRPEVKSAIAQMSNAGIHTIMVTGDNPVTAAFVARSVGLDATTVVTGTEINNFSDYELINSLRKTQVFARTTSEHKLRIVEALKRDQQVVAVTGDGINDAPALRTADIGVAMGIKGTDVAKEVADLILTDDNFARLPDAIAVGRKAYDNFRKGITYYLSAKAVLLVVFVVPLLAGMPFPFAPIQIIVIELLMDLASSTIFVSEEAEPQVMQQKPRRRAKFISRESGLLILRNMTGLTTAILVVYFSSFALGYDLTSIRTATFATWLLGHVLLALNVKQTETPLIKQGILSNRFGAGWLAGMIAIILTITFVQSTYFLLNTTFLEPVQWALVIIGAVLASGWMEVLKLFKYYDKPSGNDIQ
ncbi:MAG TPA: cation-transporting P-type ATPase, partial [Paludibacter sp.]